MMYKMLYGFYPWETASSIAELRLAIKKKINFPKNDKVSPQMKNLICKMLMRLEEERISIKELEK